ncbi:MAG: hypothetical protein ACYC2H_02840 [Thermoplasmatota archaeon]
MVRSVSMGFFDVPTVERKPWGLLGLILNILPWGGVGSIVAGAKDGHKNTIIRGILQVILTGIFIGWVWSVIDGIRIYRASAVTLTETPVAAGKAVARDAPTGSPKSAGDAGYQPQCAALTEDGSQCRNSARGSSRYCASHKGYQPPTAKGLAKRIEGEDWSDEDKLTDRKSVKAADTRPAVGKAKDTRIKVRKSPKKAAKKAKKK